MQTKSSDYQTIPASPAEGLKIYYDGPDYPLYNEAANYWATLFPVGLDWTVNDGNYL